MSRKKTRNTEKDLVKPAASQPHAEKPNTDVDLNKIGIRPLTTMRDIPMVKKLSTDVNTGKETTVFDLKNNQQPVTINTAQPYLSEEEVKKIGIYKWHAYKGNSKTFTTVVNGRRFKLDKEKFMRLKDKGLVLQDG